jgi:hypothetical protein
MTEMSVMEMPRGERHDDVAPGFDADGGAASADADAVGEPREAAESGFEG